VSGVRCVVLPLVLLLALAGCSGSTTPVAQTPTSTSPSSTVSASAAGEPTPATSASEAEGAVPMVPISRDIDLARPPVWGIPADLGWDFTVRDSNGENHLTNADGCTLVTIQRAGTIQPIPGAVPGVDDQQPTDALATKHYLALVVSDAQPDARDFAVTGPAQSLPFGFGTERKQTVEFAVVDFTYTNAETGARLHSLVAARLMPRPGAQLSVHLTCPEAAYAAARPAIDRLLVLAG
jgi:hypothetical protein